LVLIATAATCLLCIPDAARAMSLVGPPAAKVEPVPPPVQRPQEPIVPVQVDTDKMDYRRGWQYILSGHRENYFISGVSSSQHTVKFQFSFKFNLWPNASRHSVYFAYTQKSLWAVWDFANSSPFLESNYAPEIFYGYYPLYGDIVPAPGRWTYFVDQMRAGFEHESNGMGSDMSRGWNRVTGTARGGVYFGADNYVALALKAWACPFGVWNNPDITDYLGYGALGIEYGYDPVIKRWYGGGNINVAFQKGWDADWGRRSVQVTAQWRPAYEGKFLEWWKFTPYIFAQLWTGYGETLLTYNVDTTAFRIGLSLDDRVEWIAAPKAAKPRQQPESR
jgi:outer membrane phospholipase A